MKHVLALFLGVILTAGLALGAGVPSAAASIMFSYEQIVDIIDAIRIDGVKVFTEGEDRDFHSLPQDSPYYPYYGALFAWMADENRGILRVYDNIYNNYYHQWNCADIAQARLVSEVLVVAIPQYVYEMGGGVAFVVATGGDIDTPGVFYEYNPTGYSGSYAKHYAGSEEFCEAVRTALDSLSASGVGAIPEIARKSGFALGKGSKGEEVARLQGRLNELGYAVGAADGEFGAKTESAITEFQRARGLPETGEADAQTLRQLYSKGETGPTPAPEPTVTQTPEPAIPQTPEPAGAPDSMKTYARGCFHYCAPESWIHVENGDWDYYYAQEIGSLTGGYIAVTEYAPGTYGASEGAAPLEILAAIADGMVEAGGSAEREERTINGLPAYSVAYSASNLIFYRTILVYCDGHILVMGYTDENVQTQSGVDAAERYFNTIREIPRADDTPAPTAVPTAAPTDTPAPTVNSKYAGLKEAMEAIDANGDGQLSMDEIFTFG